MNIDLPFSSFALESVARAGTGFEVGFTLTVDAADTNHPLLDAGMRGVLMLQVEPIAAADAGLRSACALPSLGRPMTLTL